MGALLFFLEVSRGLTLGFNFWGWKGFGSLLALYSIWTHVLWYFPLNTDLRSTGRATSFLHVRAILGLPIPKRGLGRHVFDFFTNRYRIRRL